MVMLKSSHKDFVQEHLNVTFSTVNHVSQEEREVGGARGWASYGEGRASKVGQDLGWWGARLVGSVW